MPDVQIFPDISFLARSAAENFIRFASESIELNGSFSAVLSGGSTPLSMYSVLASEPFSERVDWSKVHLFWGDERCVPPVHPDSNFLRARTTLLDKVPIPDENIHRVQAELDPYKAAAAYELELKQYFASLPDETLREQASFDLILLGMGDDGHTASLFPGTPVVFEQERWVKEVFVDRVGVWRISMTPPLINRARRVMFLVSGSGKSWTLQKVLYGTYQPERFPAQIVRPATANPIWLVDESAAALL